jgi:hypothetical protein
LVCRQPGWDPAGPLRASLEPVEARDGARHQHQGEAPPCVPIPARREPPEAAKPRQRPLHLPPVPPKPCRRLHPPPRDRRPDPASPQVLAAMGRVIALVGVVRAGAAAPPARRAQHRRDVVQHCLQHGAVVDIGGGHHDREGQAAPIADQVQLRSRLAAIDWSCAHMIPPRRARTLMVSMLARDQSSPPPAPRRSSTSRWSWSNTPARAHSAKRRQTVVGEPQPSSQAGSNRQGVEVRAVQDRGEAVALRDHPAPPTVRRAGRAGSSDSTIAHSSSGTSASASVVMTRDHARPSQRSGTTPKLSRPGPRRRLRGSLRAGGRRR